MLLYTVMDEYYRLMDFNCLADPPRRRIYRIVKERAKFKTVS